MVGDLFEISAKLKFSNMGLVGDLTVGVTVNNNVNIANAYQEAQKLNQQSVKDQMIQSYISKIVNRTEDVTELTKNIETAVSAIADSIQENKFNLGACLDVENMDINQSNELVQSVVQGFQQFDEDTKTLRRFVTSDAAQDTAQNQTSENGQGATQETDQSITQDNKVEQEGSQDIQKFTVMHGRSARRRGGWKRKGCVKEGFVGGRVADAVARLFSADRGGNGANVTPLKNTSDLVVATNNRGNGGSATGNEHFCLFGCVKERQQPVVMRKPVIESFMRFLKEPMCFIGCATISAQVNNNTNIMNSTMKDIQTNVMTQEIYKKIETAYDKCVETISKISEEINKTIDSVAAASSVQINEININTPYEACMFKMKHFSVNQTNKLSQEVELTTMLQSITTLTSDNETRAIMTDMLGLTQGSKTDQEVAQMTAQLTEQTNTAKQTATFAFKEMSMGVVIIVIAIVFALMVLGMGSMVCFGGKNKRDPLMDIEIGKRKQHGNEGLQAYIESQASEKH